MPAAKNNPKARKLKIWKSENIFLSIEYLISILAVAKNIPPKIKLFIAYLLIYFIFLSHLIEANIDDINIKIIPRYFTKDKFSLKNNSPITGTSIVWIR